MQVTLNLPDDLATQLSLMEDKLPQILELGLRELDASTQAGFSGTADVLEFLASLPDPEEIIALRPYHPRQDRWHEHFRLNSAAFTALTGKGRVTVGLLQLNRRERIEERRLLMQTGLLNPPA